MDVRCPQLGFERTIEPPDDLTFGRGEDRVVGLYLLPAHSGMSRLAGRIEPTADGACNLECFQRADAGQLLVLLNGSVIHHLMMNESCLIRRPQFTVRLQIAANAIDAAYSYDLLVTQQTTVYGLAMPTSSNTVQPWTSQTILESKQDSQNAWKQALAVALAVSVKNGKWQEIAPSVTNVRNAYPKVFGKTVSDAWIGQRCDDAGVALGVNVRGPRSKLGALLPYVVTLNLVPDDVLKTLTDRIKAYDAR